MLKYAFTFKSHSSIIANFLTSHCSLRVLVNGIHFSVILCPLQLSEALVIRFHLLISVFNFLDFRAIPLIESAFNSLFSHSCRCYVLMKAHKDFSWLSFSVPLGVAVFLGLYKLEKTSEVFCFGLIYP